MLYEIIARLESPPGHEIYVQIMERFNAEGIKFAFPTQSLHQASVEKCPEAVSELPGKVAKPKLLSKESILSIKFSEKIAIIFDIFFSGDPSMFNSRVLGSEPAIVKEREDKVVRMRQSEKSGEIE